ncbi:MAG: GNAT family N-acetyltransferase [Alphaproteobacteria bacterium]|nr:GNAT family N-acetyltransferase [Alphaproteobacteria bacterium]
MAGLRLRRAEQSDAGGLAACIDAAYARYAARLPDLPDVSADIAEEIAQHQVWVAEIDGTIIGGLVIIPQPGFMQLANVAVHPNHAGAGLGRALLELAETESLDQGYRELRLTTHLDMPNNVRLYEHLGWRETQREGNKVSMKKLIGG